MPASPPPMTDPSAAMPAWDSSSVLREPRRTKLLWSNPKTARPRTVMSSPIIRSPAASVVRRPSISQPTKPDAVRRAEASMTADSSTSGSTEAVVRRNAPVAAS